MGRIGEVEEIVEIPDPVKVPDFVPETPPAPAPKEPVPV